MPHRFLDLMLKQNWDLIIFDLTFKKHLFGIICLYLALDVFDNMDMAILLFFIPI